MEDGKCPHCGRTDKIDLDTAVGVVEIDYMEDVDGVVSDLVYAIKRRGIEDRDDLFTAIHEAIDGHSRVIYTRQAQLGILVSRNSGHGMEEGLIDAKSFRNGIPWSQLMYCAMEQDVMERLDDHDMGLDVQVDDLGMPDRERLGYWIDAGKSVGVCGECVDADELPLNGPIASEAEYVCSRCDILFESTEEEE